MVATLKDKLQLKGLTRLVVLNPPPNYLPQLAQALPGISLDLVTAGGEQAILLFVTSLSEAAKWAAEAVRAVKPDGLLWIAYPKGGSGVKTDVNRDKLWPVLAPQGWRPVRMVALDEVWSAMRFRPEELVKSK